MRLPAKDHDALPGCSEVSPINQCYKGAFYVQRKFSRRKGNKELETDARTEENNSSSDELRISGRLSRMRPDREKEGGIREGQIKTEQQKRVKDKAEIRKKLYSVRHIV